MGWKQELWMQQESEKERRPTALGLLKKGAKTYVPIQVGIN